MKLKDNCPRLRLLLVEKVLLDNPDGLTMNEIMCYLHQHNLTAKRQTVYDDLTALNYLYDVQYKKPRHIIRKLTGER